MVPVHFDAPEEEIESLLGERNRTQFRVLTRLTGAGNLNGLLYPGGGADLDNTTAFAKAGKLVWEYAIKANDAGDIFPIYATCMGYVFSGIRESRLSFVLTLTGFSK